MVQASAETRKWWILWAMAFAGGLILLDETVIGVALPTLRGDIGMSLVASHWVMCGRLPIGKVLFEVGANRMGAVMCPAC